MSQPVIAVVAFDRISPFHLSAPCVVFGDPHPGAPSFRLLVCAVETGPLRTTAGFEISTAHGVAALDGADMIIVPSWRDPAERPPQELLDRLTAARRRGARIVGLCLGAYVLAEAGLLDGRRATTHWAYAQDFALRFPEVKVDVDVLYVEDGSLVTSAGTAAGIDCCLHLLRQGYGAEVANRVARRLVVPPHRQGGQAQYIEQPLPRTVRESRLSGLIDWVRANLQAPHDLDSLAARARRFRQLTGMTFGDWLIGERLSLTQRLLESTDHSVDFIAEQAGFGSPESLRSHFRAAFGLSPTQWRRNFQG
jgi:transcriptional regulator GlxA family with amidase domain